ncbi:hypothetical protein [Trinickia sp.]|uniref:hypothetical protein n=1 Tax=Trinickia sp. TaxID=2571163 RepID=UPI003F8193DD
MGQTCAAGFYPVFKDNMAAIGLTAPPNLFSSQVSALQTIGQLAGLIKTFGMRVTVGELIGAGDLTDKLAFAGALYASYYLGGTIGSLMVAGDAFYACKAGPGAASRMHQALFASGVALIQPMQLFLMNHPELFDTSSPNRRIYGIHAQAGTGLK